MTKWFALVMQANFALTKNQNLPTLVALHAGSTVLASSWELPWLSWLPSLSWAELGVVCNWDQKTLPTLNGSSHKG